MKLVSEYLFCLICVCFSAVLLVMSLLGAVQLAALSDAASDLEQQVQTLKQENQSLRVAYETALSLDEIERYAAEELGMQRCSPGQIIYVSAEEGER